MARAATLMCVLALGACQRIFSVSPGGEPVVDTPIEAPVDVLRLCGHADSRCVFVTSNQYAAPLIMSLENADLLCSTAAMSNPALGATHFMAWLSDATTSAKDRVEQFTETYVLVDGTPVADGIGKLTSGNGVLLAHPIDLDEMGRPPVQLDTFCGPTTVTPVWTGTSATGTTLGTNETCASWTTSMNSVYGATGLAQQADVRWIGGCNQTCDGQGALYCIEQP